MPVTGIHHVKVPVANLAASRQWYERVLPLTVELEFTDGNGVVRGVVYRELGGSALALREDAGRAAALSGWDPVAYAVATRADLDRVIAGLDERGVEHGPVVEATLGWMLAVPGPGGEQVRFYTVERHG